MNTTPRDTYSAKIAEYLSKLDWTLETPEERCELVTQMLDGDTTFNEYFEEYYTPNRSTPAESYVLGALEMIGNYMFMDNKDFKDTPVASSEPDENAVENTEDNYYKSTNTVITASDLKDPELEPVVHYYKFKRTVADERDKAGVKNKWKYDRIIGELNRDMVEAKEAIKRPVRFKGCRNVYEPIHYTECNYFNAKQLKHILLSKPRSLISELGILTYDIWKMVDRIKFTPAEQRILNSIRKHRCYTLTEIAEDLQITPFNISDILDLIVEKLRFYQTTLKVSI